MSIATEQPAAGPADRRGPAGAGSLVRAEVHRFRSRRFIHVLLGVAMGSGCSRPSSGC